MVHKFYLDQHTYHTYSVFLVVVYWCCFGSAQAHSSVPSVNIVVAVGERRNACVCCAVYGGGLLGRCCHSRARAMSSGDESSAVSRLSKSYFTCTWRLSVVSRMHDELYEC